MPYKATPASPEALEGFRSEIQLYFHQHTSSEEESNALAEVAINDVKERINEFKRLYKLRNELRRVARDLALKKFGKK